MGFCEKWTESTFRAGRQRTFGDQKVGIIVLTLSISHKVKQNSTQNVDSVQFSQNPIISVGFFLETDNGECGFGGDFWDQQRDHGPSVLISSAGLIQNLFRHRRKSEVRSQEEEMTRRVHVHSA